MLTYLKKYRKNKKNNEILPYIYGLIHTTTERSNIISFYFYYQLCRLYLTSIDLLTYALCPTYLRLDG